MCPYRFIKAARNLQRTALRLTTYPPRPLWDGLSLPGVAGNCRLTGFRQEPKTSPPSTWGREVRRHGWVGVGGGTQEASWHRCATERQGGDCTCSLGTFGHQPPFRSPVLSHLPRVDARPSSGAGPLDNGWLSSTMLWVLQWDVACPHKHSSLWFKGVQRWPWSVVQTGIPGTAPSTQPPLGAGLVMEEAQTSERKTVQPKEGVLFPGSTLPHYGNYILYS